MNFLSDNIGKILIAIIVAMIAFFGYQITKISLNAIQASQQSLISQQAKIEPPLTKEEVEEIIKNYIISHPEMLIQSLEELKQSKMKEQNEKVALKIEVKKAELEDSKLAPFSGNDQGDIKIVFFLDYNCGYCKKANEAINEILKSDVGVKVIYQLHPILGEGSEYLAKVALAVNAIAPDKFKMVHEKLISTNIDNKDDVAKILAEHDLDLANIEKELEQNEVTAALERPTSLAKYIGISAVPAIIIDDKFYPGFMPVEKLRQVIDESRSAKPDLSNDNVG
jgi:protein-disulfide isomerase